MSELIIVSLILLLVCAIDSAGDAFRAHQWQIIHHTMEVIGVAIWIAIWALFEFTPVYIAIYITGRIWLFDPLFNLIRGNKIDYIGTSSIYGKVLTWFSNLKKVKEPGFLIWVIRAMTLLAWIILLIR